MDDLRIIYRGLSTRNRLHLTAVIVLGVLTAALEMITIGAVMPLIALAAAADVAPTPLPFDVPWIDDLPSAFMTVLGVLLITGAFKVARLVLTQSMLASVSAQLRGHFFNLALHTPYRIFLNQNSADLLVGVSRAETFAWNVLQPLLQTFTNLCVTIAIGGFMLWLAPVLTLMAVAVVCGLYAGLTWGVGPIMSRNSERIDAANVRLTQTLQEASGGMRDIILQRLQNSVLVRFQSADKERLAFQRQTAVLTAMPPLLIDTARIMAVAGITVYQAGQAGGLMAGLPALGALALGIQRLLPAINGGYGGILAVKGNTFVVHAVARALEADSNHDAQSCTATPLTVAQDISFTRISFAYSKGATTLRDISFTLPKGAHLGIAGPTGSGKSTLLELFAGLLTPDSGHIRIDGQDLTPDLVPHWQAALAYVPQAINLCDASVVRNIVLDGPVDMERLTEVARAACILDLVERLPEGWDTRVGERGVRLSGGQRQRIGIARALYLQPQVLILDEATSALDPDTEDRVMAAITDLSTRPTIVTVAHRPSTLAHCSLRLRLTQGQASVVSE